MSSDLQNPIKNWCVIVSCMLVILTLGVGRGEIVEIG